VKTHADQFPVQKMCEVLKVSVTGYYYWRRGIVGSRAHARKALVVHIKAIHQSSKGRYGSPRICEELRDRGIKVSRPTVARIMRQESIRSIVARKYRVNTTDSNHDCAVAPNLLEQDFYAPRVGMKWVSDLTYVRTAEGWLYLTMVMDLADRKVIGWSLAASMRACDTSLPALKMATRNRPLRDTLLFHSDRGIQYACNEFRNLVKGQPIIQSMSKKGCCWDNAVAESFFKTLKVEMVYHDHYETRKQAELAVFEYIEVFYNRKRKHSYLGYKTPVQYEAIITAVSKAA